MGKISDDVDLGYMTAYVQTKPHSLSWCGTLDRGRNVDLSVGPLDPQAEWIKPHSDLFLTGSLPLEHFSMPPFLQQYIEGPLMPTESEEEDFLIYLKGLEWHL